MVVLNSFQVVFSVAFLWYLMCVFDALGDSNEGLEPVKRIQKKKRSRVMFTGFFRAVTRVFNAF